MRKTNILLYGNLLKLLILFKGCNLLLLLSNKHIVIKNLVFYKQNNKLHLIKMNNKVNPYTKLVEDKNQSGTFWNSNMHKDIQKDEEKYNKSEQNKTNSGQNKNCFSYTQFK